MNHRSKGSIVMVCTKDNHSIKKKNWTDEPILIVNSSMFFVKPQSKQKKWYRVNKLLNADVWQCTCYDFVRRLRGKCVERRCKHIVKAQAIRQTLEIKHDDIDSNIVSELPKICSRCYSHKMKKSGFRIMKDETKRQRYTCLDCNHRFVLRENGFRRVKADPMIIQEALNLIMCGLSYRDVARHLRETKGLRIGCTTVYYWFGKYMRVIKEFVDSILLPPQTGEVWSVDEMMVNVKNTRKTGKGFYVWFWSIVDPDTRFIIASEVSKNRNSNDARKVFYTGRQRVTTDPKFIITDSLRTYEDAIWKKFGKWKVAHIKTKSLSEGFQNRPIERYHNELRSVLNSKRGLGNNESAQQFADAQRIYHNFIRPHTGLENNQTPAEAIGIDLNLGKNKILSLIQKGMNYKYDFKKQLRKRIEHVNIVDEKDCTKVIPRTWIKKQTWREINDILRLNGFTWLANGRNGCWIR